MRRFILVLPLLIGCAVFGDDEPDDATGAPPPIRRDTLSDSTDTEMYAERYTNVKSTHKELQLTLESRGSSGFNSTAATTQLRDMINDTKHMSLLTAPPYSDQLMEIVKEFEEARERIIRGTWSQKTVADIDKAVRRFSTDFAPGKVVSRKNVLPDTRPTANNGGDTQKTSAPPRDPALGATDPTLLKSSPWLFYKAWIQEHADLEAAVAAGDDKAARVHYGRVIQSLKWMEENAEGDQKRRLATYRAEYELADRKTNGFTRFPEDFQKDRATQTIQMVGDAIKLNFNPDTP